MMRVKDDSTRIALTTGGMVLGHLIVADCFARHGFDCIITAGSDGTHKVGSLHATGKALDYRIWHVPKEAQVQLINEVRQNLGAEFDVLLEQAGTGGLSTAPHLHVELDPKPPQAVIAGV